MAEYNSPPWNDPPQRVALGGPGDVASVVQEVVETIRRIADRGTIYTMSVVGMTLALGPNVADVVLADRLSTDEVIAGDATGFAILLVAGVVSLLSTRAQIDAERAIADASLSFAQATASRSFDVASEASKRPPQRNV